MDQDKIRLLLIDDDEDQYVLIQDYLEEFGDTEFQLDWLPTYDEGLAAVLKNGHDVVLLDYNLGAKSGLDLLREVNGRGCTIPIIMLTGQGDRTVDMEAMKAGAADYLNKSEVDPYALERAIRYAIARKG